MESEGSPVHALIIDHSPEEIVISDSRTNQCENKSCGGAPCGFSDAGTNSKDAKERRASMKKLLIAVILCILFMSIEVVGGIAANSLAVLTDAAHLLSDVASFAISLFALWAAGWEATPRQTFGFFRIEVLGVLVSMQLIWLLTGILVYEAILRLLSEDEEVNGFLMFAVAAFGLAVNIVMALVLGHDHANDGSGPAHSHSHGSDHKHGNQVDIHIKGPKIHEDQQTLLDHSEHVEDQHSDHENVTKKGKNINVYSAYLHVLGDTIQSIGVMVGGAIIWYKPEWKIIDLICTLFFSVIVLATTIRMLRNVLEVLMESTPREIDAAKLERGLCETEGVVAVHELHIWAITVGKVLLACHVTITPEADSDVVLDSLIGYLNREYNISHVTIQIERQ